MGWREHLEWLRSKFGGEVVRPLTDRGLEVLEGEMGRRVKMRDLVLVGPEGWLRVQAALGGCLPGQPS